MIAAMSSYSADLTEQGRRPCGRLLKIDVGENPDDMCVVRV